MSSKLGALVVAISAIIFAASPAWAGFGPPAGVPGPVIGLGLPALAGLGFLYRRLRMRGED